MNNKTELTEQQTVIDGANMPEQDGIRSLKAYIIS